jgi:hypothetical protein
MMLYTPDLFCLSGLKSHQRETHTSTGTLATMWNVLSAGPARVLCQPRGGGPASWGGNGGRAGVEIMEDLVIFH